MRTTGVLVALIMLFASAAAKVGGGDILFDVEDAGPVIFSHDAHVTKLGPQCTHCHDSLYLTKEKHVKVAMDEMLEGRSCGACHDGKSAFSVEENCEKCHRL